MIVLSSFILIVYTFLIGLLCYGFDKLPTTYLEKHLENTQFSIIIPFRDEAQHLPELLQSIKQLNYDTNLFEVLLVNDASSDGSEHIVNDFIAANPDLKVRLLQNTRVSKAPKKDAISLAISKANHEWIITTDGDCVLPNLWLQAYDSCVQKNKPEMIVGPVTYFTKRSYLNQFQWFDIMSLQGATMGGFGIHHPFLCNGANLAYKKETFLELNGFTNNDAIASGDDIFLLEKIALKSPKRICYVKHTDVVVFTHAQHNVTDLVNQRKRWAAKTKAYSNIFSKFTGLLVLIMNMLLITLLLLSALGTLSATYALVVCIIKWVIDFVLIFKSASFFNQKKYLKKYPLAALSYPFFSVFIAVSSTFTSYKWKDRSFAQ